MKRKMILRIAFLLTTAAFMITCTKSDIEKAREDYSAAKVIPIVQGISGSASVLQTFAYDYTLTYDRSGSTWEWTGVDCTVQSVSEDTRTATVLFSVIPAAGAKAKVHAVETTVGGKVSPEGEYLVTVNPFCPLPIAGFVGIWSGTDGYGTGAQLYTTNSVTTTALNATSINITGLNFGWIGDYWGETITDGGTVAMKINANGTTEIADQYCFTTDYAGDPYEYWIKGSGTWGNCGAVPTLVISYNVYYKSDGYNLPSNTNKALKFIATLAMDGGGTKGSFKPVTTEKTKSQIAEILAIKNR
jgi:hypothetical protein